MENNDNMNFVSRILHSNAAERLKETLTPRSTPPPPPPPPPPPEQEATEPAQEALAQPLQDALEKLVRQVQDVQESPAELVQEIQTEPAQEIQSELVQAQAELAQAQAEFVQAQAELRQAEAELVQSQAKSAKKTQTTPIQKAQEKPAYQEEELDYIPYDEDSDKYLLEEEEDVNTNWWSFPTYETNNADNEENNLQPLIFTAISADDEHHIQPESATSVLTSVIDYNSDLFSSPTSVNNDQNYIAAREDNVLTDWSWFEELRSIDATTNSTTNSQQDLSSQTSIFTSDLFSPTRTVNYMALTQIEFDKMFNATDEALDETDDDDSSYESNNTFNTVHVNTANSIIPKEENNIPSSPVLGKRDRDDDDDDENYHHQKLTKYKQ
ncbi:hypothetical protein INT46_009946 [Mucor plumbeus]|uniref:Uncharacterized protein n=1 Tax=Mucor plumbeus TaxID=97098 RepID=A0A8H7R957_9FUNG|nr:hypothetical protein INT46_009946 [Mucor plumbeus]